MSAAALPIIDLSHGRACDAGAKAALIQQIAAKSREVGFFYVVNHGVPDQLLAEQLAWSRRFFALSDAAKAAIDFRALPVRRGYEPFALQTLEPGARPDQKEAFSYGSEAAPDGRPGSPFEGPNQWPGGVAGFDAPGFRRQMERYRAEMERLGRDICGLIALSLGLAEDYFTEAVARPSTDVRLLHYPPPPPAEPGARLLGAGAHTDWGLLTLLLQDDCGGLEIEVADGWLKAEPLPNALIVNLGDMVVRLTSGRYASNVHRVLRTPPGRDRYSVATFFNPHADYVVACAPTCMPATRVPAPITFADHIHEMVRRTYAA